MAQLVEFDCLAEGGCDAGLKDVNAGQVDLVEDSGVPGECLVRMAGGRTLRVRGTRREVAEKLGDPASPKGYAVTSPVEAETVPPPEEKPKGKGGK